MDWDGWDGGMGWDGMVGMGWDLWDGMGCEVMCIYIYMSVFLLGFILASQRVRRRIQLSESASHARQRDRYRTEAVRE